MYMYMWVCPCPSQYKNTLPPKHKKIIVFCKIILILKKYSNPWPAMGVTFLKNNEIPKIRGSWNIEG
jgi:hypothetical protein